MTWNLQERAAQLALGLPLVDAVHGAQSLKGLRDAATQALISLGEEAWREAMHQAAVVDSESYERGKRDAETEIETTVRLISTNPDGTSNAGVFLYFDPKGPPTWHAHLRHGSHHETLGTLSLVKLTSEMLRRKQETPDAVFTHDEQAYNRGFKAGQEAAEEGFKALLRRQQKDARKRARKSRARAKRLRHEADVADMTALRAVGFANACAHVAYQLDPGGEDDQ